MRRLRNLLLIAGLLPATADAAGINDGDLEYLGILNQKGSQIANDLRELQKTLKTDASGRPDPSAYCLEKLRSDVGLMTLEGDHLQSVLAIARKMVEPKDLQAMLLFVKTSAAATSLRLGSVRSDAREIITMCPADPSIGTRVREVLTFADDLADVVASIGGRIQ